jgi:glycine cleavage system T protein (aminomethyltransferase)
MLKSTPLDPAHCALGARMTDSGGLDMPLNYGSQIEEHHAVRRDVGMFDVARTLVLDLYGNAERDFLRSILVKNVSKLQAKGSARYLCMLNAVGGAIEGLIVYFFRQTFSGGGEHVANRRVKQERLKFRSFFWERTA